MRSDTLIDEIKSKPAGHVRSALCYTQELYPFDALFSPILCGGLSLKNRIIAIPPVKLYGEKPEEFALSAAAGGAGLICIDGGFDSKLCDGVHAHGGRIFATLTPENPLSAGFRRIRSAVQSKLMCRQALDAVKIGCDGLCLDLRDVEYDQAVVLTGSVRRTVGADTPLMCRVSVSYSYTNIVTAGADMLSIEPSAKNAPWLCQPTEAMPAGCFLEYSRYAKSSVSVPVAACGKLGYPDVAEAALREGMCDMVILQRTLLADPEWCGKAQSGKVDDIIPYINPLGRLLVNLRAKSETRKHIAVIGGGVSGMSFALCAANRGHNVDLYESGSKLGGRLIAEARPSFKADTLNYRHWLILRLCRAKNVQIFLNSYVDAAGLSGSVYDAIVFANGSRLPPLPDISGWGDIPFVPLWVLASAPGGLQELGGKRIAVLGGGKSGCECALWLKSEKKAAKVTLIENGCEIMRDSAFFEREWFKKVLKIQGIELMTAAEPLRISEGCLLLKQSCCAALVTAHFSDTFIRSIDCDLIVLAQEELADKTQFIQAQSTPTAARLYCLAGSHYPCGIIGASRAAYELAQMI